jgi:hypothetical protein
MKSKMIAMKPNSLRKAKIAGKMAVPFTNPLVGKALAEDQFRDQGGKMVRVKKQKNWFRTRF